MIVVYFGSVSLSDCQEIEEGIQPGNVYTLCFWSASRFLDLMGATCLHVRMQFSFTPQKKQLQSATIGKLVSQAKFAQGSTYRSDTSAASYFAVQLFG